MGNFKILVPIHSQIAKVFQALGIEASNLYIVDPLGYLEFNYLVENAMGVITDSGGINGVTTVMGVPCITLWDTTERPETITIGTSELAGTNPKAIKPFLDKLVSGNWEKGSIPEKWDGKAAERIIQIVQQIN